MPVKQFADPEFAAIAKQWGSAVALLEAYRRHGIDCLQHVGGAFAIAVVDAERGNGLLAVDRMGIRTLSYANPRGLLVFGTSAEAVSAHPAVGRTLSRQAIFDYLYCHMVPAPGTIYQGVNKLRPGECVVFRQGALEKRYYWRLRYEDSGNCSVEALKPRFRTLLREAADRAIGADSDVGAFLSGGTDSSTVAGLLTEVRGKPAKTYSIGFAAEAFDEMAYARIAARHFATDAHEYYVTPRDVVEAIISMAQQARPNVSGHRDDLRAQLKTRSTDSMIKGSSCLLAKDPINRLSGDAPLKFAQACVWPRSRILLYSREWHRRK